VLHSLTAPLFTTLLRGVYQIIQTDAQGRDSRLFVLACTFRSALPGWGHPQNSHARRAQWSCANSVKVIEPYASLGRPSGHQSAAAIRKTEPRGYRAKRHDTMVKPLNKRAVNATQSQIG
jgi:hypothetical protein